MGRYNRIWLKGHYEQFEAPGCNANVFPGMLINFDSSGLAEPHDVKGGVAENAFASENALDGMTVDQAYSATDLSSGGAPTGMNTNYPYYFTGPAQYIIGPSGTEIAALVIAGTNKYYIGEILMSNGDGLLCPFVATTEGPAIPPWSYPTTTSTTSTSTTTSTTTTAQPTSPTNWPVATVRENWDTSAITSASANIVTLNNGNIAQLVMVRII
jgi:hypothetical protein